MLSRRRVPSLGFMLRTACCAAVLACAPPAVAVNPLTYDLTPFVDSDPALVAASRAARNPKAKATALAAALRRLETTRAAPRDPLAASSRKWIRSLLLSRLGRTEESRRLVIELSSGASSLAGAAALAAGHTPLDGETPSQLGIRLLSVPAGVPGASVGYRAGVGALMAAGEPEVAAELVEQRLRSPLATAQRNALTLAAADAWAAAGNTTRAREMLTWMWWHGRHGHVPEQRLRELDAAPSPADDIARIALGASRRGAEDATKAISLTRARGAEDRLAKRWAAAVLNRWDSDTRDAARTMLERLRPEATGTAFERYFLVGYAEVLRKLDLDLEAASAYVAAADRLGAHPLADVARSEAAGLLARRGLPADAESLHREIVARGLRSSEHREALWQVGFQAHLSGAYGEALEHLEALLRGYGGELEALGLPWAARAGYWVARTKHLQGRFVDARDAYATVAARFPAGYYALIARQRIAEIAAAGDLPVALGAGYGGGVETSDGLRAAPGSAPGLRIVRAPELDLPVVLHRLGHHAEAREALDALAAADQLPGCGRALLSALLRREGDAERADRVLRSNAVLATVPDARAEGPYAGRYSLPYGRLLKRSAEAGRVPEPLLAALVHVESRFNPKVRSYRGAIGLTQLLPATARSIGRHLLGMDRVTVRGLKTPAVNLQIGGRYVGELLEHFRGNPALVLAAYNAGVGATRKWLRRRGHLPTDAFVETIPFSQTRRYVRRIMAVADVYRRLHRLGDQVVELPLELPLGLGPFFEERAAETGD